MGTHSNQTTILKQQIETLNDQIAKSHKQKDPNEDIEKHKDELKKKDKTINDLKKTQKMNETRIHQLHEENMKSETKHMQDQERILILQDVNKELMTSRDLLARTPSNTITPQGQGEKDQTTNDTDDHNTTINLTEDDDNHIHQPHKPTNAESNTSEHDKNKENKQTHQRQERNDLGMKEAPNRRKNITCKFHKRGQCKFGEECRYNHPETRMQSPHNTKRAAGHNNNPHEIKGLEPHHQTNKEDATLGQSAGTNTQHLNNHHNIEMKKESPGNTQEITSQAPKVPSKRTNYAVEPNKENATLEKSAGTNTQHVNTHQPKVPPKRTKYAVEPNKEDATLGKSAGTNTQHVNTHQNTEMKEKYPDSTQEIAPQMPKIPPKRTKYAAEPKMEDANSGKSAGTNTQCVKMP